MPGTAYIDIIAGTAGIIGMDVNATIDEVLHDHSDELGQTLADLVKAKTPVDTGALESDITFENYPDPGGDDLVYIYSETGEQIQAWDRVYVEYQEGGPLGMATYTNDPRLMFLDTAQGDGVVATEAWAQLYIQEALDMCVGGAGIPI